MNEGEQMTPQVWERLAMRAQYARICGLLGHQVYFEHYGISFSKLNSIKVLLQG